MSHCNLRGGYDGLFLIHKIIKKLKKSFCRISTSLNYQLRINKMFTVHRFRAIGRRDVHMSWPTTEKQQFTIILPRTSYHTARVITIHYFTHHNQIIIIKIGSVCSFFFISSLNFGSYESYCTNDKFIIVIFSWNLQFHKDRIMLFFFSNNWKLGSNFLYVLKHLRFLLIAQQKQNILFFIWHFVAY